MHVGITLVGKTGEEVMAQRVQVEFGKGMVLLGSIEQNPIFLLAGERSPDTQDTPRQSERNSGEIELASLAGQALQGDQRHAQPRHMIQASVIEARADGDFGLDPGQDDQRGDIVKAGLFAHKESS